MGCGDVNWGPVAFGGDIAGSRSAGLRRGGDGLLCDGEGAFNGVTIVGIGRVEAIGATSGILYIVLLIDICYSILSTSPSKISPNRWSLSQETLEKGYS